MLDGLLFKLHLMDTAEYATEELFEKSKEDFEKQVLEMSASEKAEMLESHGKVVDETFEDGGRWSNYRTRVFKFYHNREHVYISVSEEIPATEIQDGGDFGDPQIEQVYPHKVETTVYKTTKAVAK
jgi:hypothetical protein